MSELEDLAQRFFVLFAPGETGHGYYTLIGDGVREDCTTEGKLDNAVKGFSKKPVTPDLWLQHLSGKRGLGIVPIRKDGTVRFGAIDIDVYGIDPVEVANKILTLQLPLIPCRSKSGGVHAYMFTSEPVSAFAMQTRLRDIAAMLGHGGVEIFPKQTKLAEQDEGSWINLPFFNGDEGTRYAVRPDGERLTMEQFLARAEQVSVNAEYFKPKTTKEKETFPDGPPCLNHLATIGYPTLWNVTLFNIALYFKRALPSGWERAVEQVNAGIQEPMASGEVAAIIKSVASKEFNYQCNNQPLSQYCNASRCRMRKFGVGGGENSFPILGELRKLNLDPPIYFWDMTIDGKTITIELTADQVQNPREFKRRVWEVMDIAVPVFKQSTWDNTLNETRKNNFRILEPLPEDASAEGQVWELIEAFCTRNEGTKEDLLLGRPWTEDGRTYFRLSDLMRFLASQQFKDYKVQQLAKVIKLKVFRDKKGNPLPEAEQPKHHEMNIKGKFVNLWSLPEFAKQTSSFDVPDMKDESPF